MLVTAFYGVAWCRRLGLLPGAKNLPSYRWFSIGAFLMGGIAVTHTVGLYYELAPNHLVAGLALACLLGIIGWFLGTSWQRIWNL